MLTDTPTYFCLVFPAWDWKYDDGRAGSRVGTTATTSSRTSWVHYDIQYNTKSRLYVCICVRSGERYDRELEKQVEDFVAQMKEEEKRDQQKSGIKPVKAPSDVTPEGKLTDDEIILTNPGNVKPVRKENKLKHYFAWFLYRVDPARNVKPQSLVLWPDFDWCRNVWVKPDFPKFVSTSIPVASKIPGWVATALFLPTLYSSLSTTSVTCSLKGYLDLEADVETSLLPQCPNDAVKTELSLDFIVRLDDPDLLPYKPEVRMFVSLKMYIS